MWSLSFSFYPFLINATFTLEPLLVRAKSQPYDIATNISYIPKYYFTTDFAALYVL